MRTAIVHDWLTTFTGAEKVLEQLFKVVQPNRLFTLLDHMKVGRPDFIKSADIRTSFIQSLPFSASRYRDYLALFPLAIEQLDVTEFDLVISSHYCVSHGVLTRPDQPHLVYTHSPVRYAWDLQFQYLNESGLSKSRFKGSLARAILHYLRTWDYAAGQRPTAYAANSKFIAERIFHCYGKPATVVYPPVSVDEFVPGPAKREDFYLTASRMVPYKKISLIVEAFSQMPQRKLVVIGDGPEFQRIKAKAGKNVSLLGYQSKEVLLQQMQTTRAFVFAAQEDFGIVPVEAQACGTPVIALGRGGTTETVIDGQTGILFPEQTTESLKSAVDRFEAIEASLRIEEIRANAERFSADRFRREFSTFVDQSLEAFQAQRRLVRGESS